MAEFLTTVETSSNIEKIIKKSNSDLTLVTPFLKLSKNIVERVIDAEDRGVKITLIYGKNELSITEKEKLHKLNNIEVYFYKDLHAKCYHNENTMIITSMNLYEFSERNNREMGILLNKRGDYKVFNDAIDEIKSIKHSAKLEKGLAKKELLNNPKFEISEIKKQFPDYKETKIYYIQTLIEVFNTKYPNTKLELNDYGILVHNFPSEGIFLEVGGNVTFNVPNEEQYFLIKDKHRNEIRNELPRIRIFRNHLKIQVYLEKDFEAKDNKEGAELRINKFMKIIDVFYKYLSK